jgi:tetratricopeptide (TPR) repeat protein
MEKEAMKRLVLIAGLFAVAHATASGDYGPSFTRYKAYSAPDIAIERFQEGKLGVLQPGMQRVYLYTAWRAMILGARVKSSPGLDGGLGRADGSAFGYGWGAGDVETPSKDEWLRETRMAESNFGACPIPSNNLALVTIKAINKRKDATPARVKAWVDAQELVSIACKAAENGRYRDAAIQLEVAAPPPLDNNEPAYWRQLRGYQRAATQFHAEHYAEASAQFSQIGASADHPMRDLGRYLALRSEVRLAVKQGQKADETQRQLAYSALEQRGRAILADASLAPLHEATRATLRSVRVQLTPLGAISDLGKYLADAAADPFIDDRLGDWAYAMRLADERPDFRVARIKAIRSQYEFIDWIENLRNCAYPVGEDKTCRVPARHALDRWQRTKSRPWLAASMMMSETLNPALEKAATAVEPGAPEYLTVRYHLARLYRLAGRTDEARAVSDAALALDMSDGSRNLLREERFAVATSVSDATAYMLRVDVDSSRASDKPVQGFNDDVLNWLINGLSAADMVVLARQPVLDAAIRARIASGAWMRADLLGKHDIAKQALDVLEPLAPLLQSEIANYRRAQSPADRRHLMLLTALRFGLSPKMTESSAPIEAIDKNNVVASNWCSFKPDTVNSDGAKPFPWRLPPMPAPSDRDVVKSELDKLLAFKTATGFIGDHVLARAKSNASDPDLPWLLHVVVASTRGGCLDENAKQLSREAFSVLHKRFPRDEWTKKTPYFY